MLAGSLGAGTYWVVDDCFKVDVEVTYGGKTVSLSKRKGIPVDPVAGDTPEQAADRACQKASLQAAITFISNHCPDAISDAPGTLDIPGESGIQGAGTLGPELQSLLDAGRICVESSRFKDKEKAAGSYPPSSVGDEIVPSGHPGVNVSLGSLPSGTECTKDENDEYQFDEKKIAELAVTLAHELHHVKNPRDHSMGEKEIEKDAYKYEGEVALAILCCASSSQDVKDKMCELIGEVNAKLVEWNIDPIDTGTKCSTEESSSAPVSTYDFEQVKVKYKHYAGNFPLGALFGYGYLHPADRSIILELNGIRDVDLTIDFSTNSEPSLANFQPTAFTFELANPGPNSILIAGYNTSTLAGEIVRVTADFSQTPTYTAQRIHSSTNFRFPLDVAVPSFAVNTLMILEGDGARDLVSVNTVNGTSSIVIDAVTYPGSNHCSFIERWPLVKSENEIWGIISIHSSSSYEKSKFKVGVVDVGLDGIVDGPLE